MKVKEKILLNEFIYAEYHLKRWSQQEGFYIECNPYFGQEVSIESKGLTLIECIDNLNISDSNEDKLWSFKKELFSEKSEEIIKTFNLTDEEKEYIIQLGVWADF